MKGRCLVKEKSLMWLVKAPFRWLIMARDAYIRSITSCSGAGIFSGGGSSGFGQFSGNFQICDPPSTALPRSFTLTSSKARDRGGPMTRGGRSGPLDRRRNYRCVVSLGRIDEEISCEEEDSLLDYGKCKILHK
ncbi:unnamed protein product [Arabis nemorensis]|uniref:Uncharacterized protein n=1 Tax=Arabis nemorensis TaxID=586526 RepID=A0A565AWS1_9BRAS|nr:unnamed protein product [Arabis nemorensis]